MHMKLATHIAHDLKFTWILRKTSVESGIYREELHKEIILISFEKLVMYMKIAQVELKLYTSLNRK